MKLKLKDLSIDNYVTQGIVFNIGHSGDGYAGVSVLKNIFMSFSEFYKIDEITPLKINKDLLIDAGFEEHYVEFGGTYNYILRDVTLNNGYLKMNTSIPWLYFIVEEDESIGVKRKIKYFHQLQNLVYDLSEKELELKNFNLK
jgi:hypothetical protein